MKKKLQTFIACLSLSIIIICGPWINSLANYNSSLHTDTLRLFVFTLLVSILILSSFFYFLIQKTLYSKNKFFRFFTYFIFCLSFAFFFRSLIKIISFEMKPWVYIVVTLATIAVILALIALSFKNSKKLLKIVTSFFVIFFPLSLLILTKISSGFFYISQNNIAPIENNKPKVIWIIFDEWDQYLTFEKREKNIHLPQIDDFKEKYFSASNVYQIANITPLSLSSYTTGLAPTGFKIVGHNKIKLDFIDTPSKLWGSDNSIFSKLALKNVNSSIVGWFLPYDRIFDKYIVKKKYYKNKKMAFKAIKNTYVDLALFYFLRPINKLSFQKITPLKNYIIKIVRKKGSQLYKEIYASTKDVLIDPKINFCFLHFSIPHPPVIFDRNTNKLSTKVSSYSDQLMLVDKTIEDIKNILIDAKLWDSSTLILTSDHWFRPNSWIAFPESITISEKDKKMAKKRTQPLVPLLIKMPYQNQTISYDKPFNAIVLHNLVLDIFDNKISNETDLKNWLDNLDEEYKKINLNFSF
ncbi:MAG: hypothetical protein K940chlam1_00499 [Candidatus Anoxychlamydiales bacterium]|nr:hypothetical protein [Candidatus Anoxychlamydiales bacterium]